jgi:hypothetical protein
MAGQRIQAAVSLTNCANTPSFDTLPDTIEFQHTRGLAPNSQHLLLDFFTLGMSESGRPKSSNKSDRRWALKKNPAPTKDASSSLSLQDHYLPRGGCSYNRV